MQIDLEKILDHANERLTDVGPASEREQQLEAFKSFLKIETERLRIRHRFGLGGGEIASGRSYLVDLVICRVCQIASSETSVPEEDLLSSSAIALGGYGRRELAPFSDVDILFLHAGRQSKGARKFAEKVLYLLWDMGLTIGHSFRSVSECVQMARGDLVSRNSMAEARLITGNTALFRRFTHELDEEVFRDRKQTELYLETMKQEIEARYAKFGAAVCLQEPNIKESAGGLRDLHSVLWIGHSVYGSRTLDDLRAEDHISGAEYATARRAYDFISRVRNEAHFETGRRTDLLALDLQPAIAESLGYQSKRGMKASEIFMRDYYQRAHELHSFSESFLVRAFGAHKPRRRFVSMPLSLELRQGKLLLTRRKSAREAGADPSFTVREGKLYFTGDAATLSDSPLRLLEIFAIAQSEGVLLSDELKLAVRDSLGAVDRRFRSSREAGELFTEILRKKGRVGNTLRMMHETGFLGRFIPEFGRITFLVQHDFYHRYTIDEHTLKAIEMLDQVASSREQRSTRFGKAFAEIADAAPLYLGLLMHDVGKGKGSGHASRGGKLAERVASRLALDAEGERRSVFLVKNHLLMSHVSQRRDLAEEKLVKNFAEKIETLDQLNMLFLLTYADTSAVAPGVWNEWKAGLLEDLYGRARLLVTGGKPARWDKNRREVLKQKVIDSLSGEIKPSVIERHFALMPERYLRATDADHVVKNLRFVRDMGDSVLLADWHVAADRRCTELTVYTHDSSGLFARIAGTMTAHGVNILSADLYTREDGIVIDAFKLCDVSGARPVRPERWARIEEDLRKAIEGTFEVATAIEKAREMRPRKFRRRAARTPAEPTVHFDSEASAASTVVEVRAEDEPGIAYRIASTLASLGLSISFARLSTEKNLALDVFYVTSSDGEKLAPAEMPDVERALLDVLGGKPNHSLMKEAV